MVKDEYTLVLVKPDGVKTRHIGDIITRIERKGYTIEALKMIIPTEEKLRQHYADKVDKPFFPELLEYMTEGPIVGIVVSGTNVIQPFTTWRGQLTLVRLNGERSVVTTAGNGRMATCGTSFTRQIRWRVLTMKSASGSQNLTLNRRVRPI